ncbi:hypothetical protein [Streptomyces colonosanans]|uniref:hypothetical protein n=1 Tax=Streptomyces colonosanans TaxID=1428652 RepID=UPI0015A5FF76|nr:hypothetical protein [Streptomyces colonosanans]
MNPHAEQADQRSLAWLARHRLLDGQRQQADRLRRQRSGHLAARTNPEVSAEMLRLLSDWYVWLFAFDDGYCEDRERGSRSGPLARTTALLARTLDPEPPAADVDGPARTYVVALREIRDRVAAQASRTRGGARPHRSASAVDRPDPRLLDHPRRARSAPRPRPPGRQ